VGFPGLKSVYSWVQNALEDLPKSGMQDLRVRAEETVRCGHPQRPRRSELSEPSQGHIPGGPNQLWVADLTYIRVLTGFVYLAVILDAWSHQVVGWTISRRIDIDLALAALEAAVITRQPPLGYLHHSDRGSEAYSEPYQKKLKRHGLRGSMGGAATCMTTPRRRAS
jgi:transposase InsO family protein